MGTRGLPLCKLIEGLEIAKDERGLAAAADAFTRALGLRWFAHLAFGEGPPLLLTSLPQRAADEYLGAGHHLIDPVVKRARRIRRPFYWRCRDDLRRIVDAAALFRLVDEVGIVAGLTVPLPSSFGRFALFALISDVDDPSLENWPVEAGDLLLEAALRFHIHAETRIGRRADQGSSLSPREMECLAWLAHGKTLAVTGEILGISKRTVVHHLEEAKLKLGAVNVTQAVAKAIRSNLIG